MYTAVILYPGLSTDDCDTKVCGLVAILPDGDASEAASSHRHATYLRVFNSTSTAAVP